MKENIVGIFLAIMAAIATIVLIPIISFAGAYLFGWILKVFIGDTVVNGLNLVLATDRFTTDNLPLVCATLGLIGGYFKTSIPHKEVDDKHE